MNGNRHLNMQRLRHTIESKVEEKTIEPRITESTEVKSKVEAVKPIEAPREAVALQHIEPMKVEPKLPPSMYVPLAQEKINTSAETDHGDLAFDGRQGTR